MSYDINATVTRGVSKTKDIYYTAQNIRGVLIPRDDGKRVLHICLPADYKSDRQLMRLYEKLVAKAKQRDGIAGVEHYHDREFRFSDSGEVLLVRVSQ